MPSLRSVQDGLFNEPISERARLVIEAYERTGTVWAAGHELRIAGQTVHKILRAVGYKLNNSKWTPEEIEALRHMVDSMTIAEIAFQLGRPYNGVACKISELGIGIRYGNKQQRKPPRGAGYDKASVTKYLRDIDRTGVKLTIFARRHGLTVEGLVRAIERHNPEWLNAYRLSAAGDIVEKTCPYCATNFVPSNGKQEFCTRRCSDLNRQDLAYFGGKRRQNTRGLAEGVCQLCLKETAKLSSHHLFGKENDPDNEHLVALCNGCHQIIGILGGRIFLDDGFGWERLIHLVYARRNGHNHPHGVWASVEIEELGPEDLEDEEPVAEVLG